MNGRLARTTRVHQYLQAAGAPFDWRELADNTATAALAAAALSCSTAEIAKSIVFRRKSDEKAVVAVLCGDDRVDTGKLSALIGGAVGKADAAFVKEHCGFEIGGVAPLAHHRPTLTLLDERLRRFTKIWAAAGSAYTVFGITPAALAQVAEAEFVALAEEKA